MNFRAAVQPPKENIIKTSNKLAAGLLAAIPLFSLTLAAPAQAQQSVSVVTAPAIRGFAVDEVRRLAPGVELDFMLYGTPGGRATLSIAGARRNLNLTETNPGQYEGTYTLSSRDRVTGSSRVTANLRVANLVTSGVLSESLLRVPGMRANGRNGRDARDARDYAANAPRIEKFQVVGSTDLRAGNDINFAVYGTPGAKVDMSITGARGTFFLPEVAPGEYRGDYVIRRADNIRPNSVVVANLRIDNRVATATLAQPLQATAAIQPVAQVARYCTNCATIEAVNVVEVNGDGNYLGTIGGGVVGAALGSQVGKGSGKTAAQIAGAIGGAYIGRNIERNAKKTNHYEVVVRFQNGGTQTVTYENDPGVRVGEKVRVNDGVLTRDQ
ncbi:MAG: glycine zipper 2TM domain-containing protein [Pseudomonadota bacterium]